jgi:CubicO group peptidase (beta-lactamase class C family)
MRPWKTALAASLLLSLAQTGARAADAQAVLTSAMAGTKVPAMALLVMRDGKIAETGVFGARRLGAAVPAQADDLWLIGSDAKPMTATLIARLVDRGVLTWDAPLAKMLPELAATMRPEYRDATLVELLSHRAGLPHDVSDMAFFNTFFDDTRPAEEQRLAYVARALQDKPVGSRGKSSYSNTGFLLAAVIAERATHLSYEALMTREVFAPLGMQSVKFGVADNGGLQGHHAGKVATLKDANPEMFAPAGNIRLSMRDWASFCLDQMAGYHGQGKLLAPATYRMMETRLPGADMGLAWGVQDTIMSRQGPALTHAGSDGNWMALVLLFPETQNGALVAANAGEDMDGDKATKAALKAVLPELAPAAYAAPKR